MMLRFQTDVNLNQLILRAACRREPALDFHTAEAAGLQYQTRLVDCMMG